VSTTATTRKVTQCVRIKQHKQILKQRGDIHPENDTPNFYIPKIIHLEHYVIEKAMKVSVFVQCCVEIPAAGKTQCKIIRIDERRRRSCRFLVYYIPGVKVSGRKSSVTTNLDN